MIGYLDVETAFDGSLTVVGVLRSDRGLIQLVGCAITPDAVTEVVDGLDTLCTFNGELFDLPVLQRQLGVDLFSRFRSLDLSVECRRTGRRGGLKAIEARLLIPRTSNGLSGYDALLLWERWQAGDAHALQTLLDYNRDDVINLALLERRLRGDLGPSEPAARLVVGV